MSRGFSLYLDGVRALAALVVLMSHFAYARFTDGDYLIVRELNLGSDAVILFFVMSGCVVAFTADTKDRTWKTFAFNRATRLYSVALPAVALTIMFDAIGSAINPIAYDGWWHGKEPLSITSATALLFANEWGPIGIRLGSNGPYWSLSYEVGYYILFGIGVYLNGLRRALLLVGVAVVLGPKILVLMPAWICGVVVWRHLAANRGPLDRRQRNIMLAAALGSVATYAVCIAADAPDLFLRLSTELIGSKAIGALRFSDEFLWNALVGALFASHLYAVGRLMRDSGDGTWAGRPVRWLSGASFSIYLVHYPSLQIVDSVLPVTPGLGRDAALLAATLVICLAFAHLFERRLPAIRKGLRQASRGLSEQLSRGHDGTQGREDGACSKPGICRPQAHVATRAPRIGTADIAKRAGIETSVHRARRHRET